MDSANAGKFPLVIDHIYLWVSKGAPGLALLRQLGLEPHQRITVHEGQGSASQSILFKNCYLEFVWIEDRAEFDAFASANPDARSAADWQETGVSPFGIGLHYRTPDGPPLPISARIHRAPWMPEDSYIEVLPRTSDYLPLFFILHGSLAYWDCREGDGEHPLGVKQLTQITITVTALEELDPLSAQLMEHGVVAFKQGETPLMALTFDQHARRAAFDARPAMPLVIHY